MVNQPGANRSDAALLRVTEVANILSLSRTKTYDLILGGLLQSVKIGGSRRVRRSDLEAYIANLTTEGDGNG